MAEYYLSFDGVDDYLKVPSLTFTEVQLDASVIPVSGAFKAIMNADGIKNVNNFSMQMTANSSMNITSQVFTNVYFNGVAVVNSATKVPVDTRFLIRAVNDVGTTDSNWFANGGGLANMQGKAYSLKFLNSSTVVAQYDFTKGHANDISGNGKNATVVGATFIDTQANSVINSSCSMQGVGSLVAIGIKSSFGAVSMNGIGSVAATGTKIFQLSCAMSGVGSLSAAPTRISQSSVSMNGVGNLTALSGNVTSSSAAITGVASLNASYTVINQSTAALQGVASVAATGKLTLFGSADISGVGSLNVTSKKIIFSSSQIRGGATVAVITSAQVKIPLRLSIDASNFVLSNGNLVPKRLVGKVVLRGEL